MMYRFVLTAFLASVAVPALASTTPFPAPNPEAGAWVVRDVTSGQILASSNPDARMEPASLTKIMTAYVVFSDIKANRLKLDQQVTISKRAWQIPSDSSKMFLRPGERVSIQDLLYGLLVQSGNDAAIALAEASAGSVEAFVARMNKAATAMGLKATHFASPSGLPDPATYTTARELALLTDRYLTRFGDISARFDTTKEYTYAGITQRNRNSLLWQDATIDGVKTGHTQSAGYCLIASALRNDRGVQRRVVSVVLGTKSSRARAAAAQQLLNWGYTAYRVEAVSPAGTSFASPRVWQGEAEQVQAVGAAPRYIAVPTGAQVSRQIRINSPLIAPLAQGQEIGAVTLLVDGKPLVQAPLVAQQAVAEGGLFTQVYDSATLWVGRHFGVGPAAQAEAPATAG